MRWRLIGYSTNSTTGSIDPHNPLYAMDNPNSLIDQLLSDYSSTAYPSLTTLAQNKRTHTQPKTGAKSKAEGSKANKKNVITSVDQSYETDHVSLLADVPGHRPSSFQVGMSAHPFSIPRPVSNGGSFQNTFSSSEMIYSNVSIFIPCEISLVI